MNTFIKLLMDSYGINQKELAGILGISPAAVSQWKECSTMSVETLIALSRLFQITVEELVAERFADETLEQKWNRMYNFDGYEWADFAEHEDEDAMLNYLEKLSNINSRFYKLLYKKMKGIANIQELNELSMIANYFRRDPWQSAYFYDKRFDYSMDEIEIWITDILDKAIGIENEEALIWELQRIYQNIKMISCEQVHETRNDALFYAWYGALTQESKDAFLTNMYRQEVDNSVLYELIKRGGRVLYVDSDLPQTNFDRIELDRFEGEKTSLDNLDEIKKIFWCEYGCYDHLTYNQYQVVINKIAMKTIEMEHKYKKKNPIKYWEFIKQNVKL